MEREFKDTVATYIASLRKQRGWSQAGLARRAGISASTIAMYETNRRAPDGLMMEKLAGALSVSVETLTGAEQHGNPDPADTHLPGSDTTLRVEDANLHPADTKSDELTLQVSVEEARVLLAMRMNPTIAHFVALYVGAAEEDRERLERTWNVMKAFQAVSKDTTV